VKQATILYDSDCGFCRWSLEKILRWDQAHRLRLLALKDPEAAELLAGMAEDERMASWHLVDAHGRVYSGGAAAAPLLRLLRGGRPLAMVLNTFPRTTDAAYRWAARNRGRLRRSTRRKTGRVRNPGINRDSMDSNQVENVGNRTRSKLASVRRRRESEGNEGNRSASGRPRSGDDNRGNGGRRT
jgi:predicted DCC family thiol-disulfide oxidoreductase YuxK